MASVITFNGLTDGTVVTATNVDTAGNAILDAGDDIGITIVGAGSIVVAADGFSATSPATGSAYITATHTATPAHVIRAIYKGTAHPSATDAVIAERSATGFISYVNHYAEGYLRFASATNGTFTASQTPVFAPTDELVIDKITVKGTTTANGRIFYRVVNRTNLNWVAAGNSEFFYDTGYTANTGIEDTSLFRVGSTSTAPEHAIANWKIVQFDGLASVNTSLDATVAKSHFLPAYVASANALPTASAGTNKTIEIGKSGTLTGTDSDSDGTVASRQWSLVSSRPTSATAPTISGATTNTLTVSPGTNSAGVHTYQYQVTDNSGGLSPATTVLVFVPTNSVKPIQVIGTTEYTSLTAASIVAAVTDGVDSTGATSPAGATTAKSIRFRLAPLVPLVSFSIPFRNKLSGAGTGTCVINLIEGATIRYSWTRTLTATEPPAAATENLTSSNGTGNISQITNWTQLDLEITWTS